jgi:hypothetical protein
MKKVALIHLAQDTTVTRMKHHKPVEKVIATAACGAGTHVKRSTDEMAVTCQACRTALAAAKAQREAQATPAHVDHAPDAKGRPAHTCACGRVFYGKTVSKQCYRCWKASQAAPRVA